MIRVRVVCVLGYRQSPDVLDGGYVFEDYQS